MKFPAWQLKGPYRGPPPARHSRMLTCDSHSIRLDCPGYLMHRIARAGSRLVEN